MLGKLGITKKRVRLKRSEHLAKIQMTLINLDYSDFIDALNEYISDYYTTTQISNYAGYSENVLNAILSKKYVPDLDNLTYILEAVNLKLSFTAEFKKAPVRHLTVNESTGIVNLIKSII